MSEKKKIPPVWVWVLIVLILAAVITVFMSTPEAPVPAEKTEASAETPVETTAAAEPETPVAEEKPAEPKVLAKVEGYEITEQDLIKFVQTMGPQGMALYQNPEGRQAMINEIISQRLLILEAEKGKMDETEEYRTAYAAAVENIRSQFLTQLAARELLKDVPNVTSEDVRKYYDENPDRFMQPERVHARHILINDDESSAEKLAKIQADLKAGRAFDEIAREVSVCPSKEQGGDLGEFQRGQMVPEFEQAAFALENPGDISEPVKTQFGWHIIKLDGRKPAEVVPFERVQPQLTQELQNQRISEALNTKLGELRKSYNVEILEPELDHSPDPEAETAQE